MNADARSASESTTDIRSRRYPTDQDREDRLRIVALTEACKMRPDDLGDDVVTIADVFYTFLNGGQA